MDKLRKLFGEYEMTWKRLIIFSVICGVYSALVLVIPGVKETALREIGVGYECWFILAIFVVSNCKNAKDAMFKCFIFFLISQPLIYLVQMIFVDRNLLLEYYKPWFYKTILTIPGAFIAYQIKRNDLLGSIVLAVAGTFNCLMGIAFFLKGTISYYIYGIFLLVSSVLFGFIFCKKKKNLIIYIVIILVLSIALSVYYFADKMDPKEYTMELSNKGWYLTNCRFTNLDADIEDDVLKITYYSKKATGDLTLSNDSGEALHYEVYVENGELVVK